MSQLSILLLGSFNATLDEEPIVTFRTNKAEALLIYLAAEQLFNPSALRRETIMALLWPDMPTESARQNLRQTLYLLRQIIPKVTGRSGGKVAFLKSDRKLIQINPEANIELDLRDFTSLLAVDTTEALEQAAALYRGDFLSDFSLPDSNPFESWATNHRASLRHQMLNALSTLATRYMAEARYEQTARVARRQLELDELREGAHRQLMEALARNGQQSLALAQYDTCRELLQAQLDVEPDLETQRLMVAIRDGRLKAGGTPLAIRGYELRESIGEGGFGIVYRAIQPTVGREVAIKAIRRRYVDNPDFIRRFETEAQIVALLEHPYIVPLYDYWREPGGAYLVMRWMRGGSLADTLTKGPLPLNTAVKLTHQIAEALDTAHRHGVVHRDLKPANILLDEVGNSYLTDFGIAKDLVTDRALTNEGDIIGSPYYLTPEQILNEPLSPHTDIYSFGLTLFEILVGQKPFADHSPASLIHKQLNEPVPSLLISHPELPAKVDDVIQKATAKQPSHRFQTAVALAEAFQSALSSQTDSQVIVPVAKTDVINPYKGLRPFEEADAGRFFGRQELINRLLAHLTENRFLAVVGPSGSGKSSVVKAGVLPAIRQGALPGSDNWFIAEMVPGTHPMEELEAALFRVAVNPPQTLLPQLQEDERGFARVVKRILPPGGGELLLLVDQFEEAFTLVDDEARRRFFLNSLAATTNDLRGRIWLIITLRADFYDRPLMYPALGQLMRELTQAIAPPTKENLAEAIQKPVEREGIVVEEKLLTQLINDVYEQPGALPLLQYALTELFEQRQHNRMMYADYEAIGGISGALANRADALYLQLDEEEQAIARQLFLRLVTLGEGTKDTRRRVLRIELSSIQTPDGETTATSQNHQIDKIIELFGRYRLLSFDRDPATRQPTIEVAHETLLTAWPRFREWIEINRDGLRLHRRLNRWTTDWEEANRDPGLLLRETRLNQIIEWQDEVELSLTASETAFLETSLHARQQREIERQQTRSRELALSARVQLNSDPELALLLATHAINSCYTPEAEEVIHLALSYPKIEMTLGRHEGGVTDLVYNLDGSQLVTADRTGMVKIWDTSSGELLRSIKAHDIDVARIVFNQDFTLIATVGADSLIKVWEEATGEHRITLVGHKDWAYDAAFSPDGTHIATVAEDQKIIIWDLTSGTEIKTLSGHTGWVHQVIYTPDGTTLITISSDTTIKFWDVQSGQEKFTISEHQAGVYGMAITQDWTRMATESFDNAIKIWDLTTLNPESENNSLLTLAWEPNDGNATTIAFTTDGQKLLAPMNSGGIMEWDVFTGQRLRHIPRIISSEWTIAISPDNRHLAVSSEAGAVKICSLVEQGELLWRRYPDGLNYVNYSQDGAYLYIVARGDGIKALDVSQPGSLTFGQEVAAIDPPEGRKFHNAMPSPDGKSVAILDSVGTVKLVNCETWQILLSWEAHEGAAVPAAFSPSEPRIATAGVEDHLIKIWDSNTGKELLSLQGHTSMINNIRYSRDGKYLISASADQSSRIWDAHNGEEQMVLKEISSQRALAVSPDNRSLVTATDRLFIWDFEEWLESGKMKKVQQWSGHTDLIRSADFSPDGRLLATAAADHNIIIWDVGSGKNLMTFYDQKSFIFDIKFSPDGTQLVSTTFNGVLTIYALNRDELLNLAYKRLTRWFTPEECRRYLGSKTCPPAPWSIEGQGSPFPG